MGLQVVDDDLQEVTGKGTMRQNIDNKKRVLVVRASTRFCLNVVGRVN